ncbi:hypothetical protein [Inquilinus sp. CAU 1745]|uniref:hypothetical protein n=1 Tax=Inquilinus sp. CAU 1745 TaxID=3140369 RepID=UPI00325A95FE
MNAAAMNEPDWQEINAYVDGELDADAAARVAAGAASDPRLAARIAELTRLKAASIAALDAGPIAGLPPLADRSRSRSFRPVAWAATILLLLAVGAGAAIHLTAAEGQGDLRTIAMAEHAAWLERDAEADPLRAAGMAAAATIPPRGVPDLSGLRLWVSDMTVSATGEAAGLFVGYSGTRGCRLGLWIGAASGDAPQRPVKEIDGLRTAVWRVGETGYALVAEGMALDRFDAVVDLVEEFSRHSDDGVADDTVLARNGDPANAPCIG